MFSCGRTFVSNLEMPTFDVGNFVDDIFGATNIGFLGPTHALSIASRSTSKAGFHVCLECEIATSISTSIYLF